MSTDTTRLRIERIEAVPGPDGRGSAEVELSFDGRQWTGEGQGLLTREGNLRMGAEATLAAVRAAVDDRLAPTLGGIKAVRAFDEWLVIVSIEVDVAGRHLRLLGAEAAVGGDLVRGSVLAVLDALNRVLERYLD
ncbi:MAG: hypothetical protein KJO11_11350 [Gemmatimonadetes bacterium]|nr:hypothetical protein [Gemmatimonadota bacterium]